jgi:hypothetical protein
VKPLSIERTKCPACRRNKEAGARLCQKCVATTAEIDSQIVTRAVSLVREGMAINDAIVQAADEFHGRRARH